MKPFASILCTLLLLFSLPSLAVPAIDFTLTASAWQPDYSGEVGQGADTATLEELGFDDDDHTMITAILKHPVPVVPNIRLQHTDLATEATGTLTASLTVEGTTFTATDEVNTDLDLSHTDVTLFYSPLNNWVQFDVGLTARKFDGNVSIASTTESAEAEVDGWIPLAYAGARFELPLTGWYVGGTLNTISYDGNSLTDFSGGIGYVTSGLGAGVVAELGYRTFSLEIDDDEEDVQGNIDIDGLYFSLGLKF